VIRIRRGGQPLLSSTSEEDLMKTPSVTKVRSTTGVPAEHDLHWLTDEVFPYCLLDGYIVRVSDHGAFTQRLNPRGIPVGKVLNWSGLAEALTVLGWEPC
jgi:hypothetical protein